MIERIEWTADRDDMLRILAANPCVSASQAADEIGSITKNAVLARCHRLSIKWVSDPDVKEQLQAANAAKCLADLTGHADSWKQLTSGEIEELSEFADKQGVSKPEIYALAIKLGLEVLRDTGDEESSQS